MHRAVTRHGRHTGCPTRRLRKKRGELIERSFAHCYETGAMRRVYLQGRENILKRQLIHVGAFNLSLIFRQTLGAGAPRELHNRRSRLIFGVFWSSSTPEMKSAPSRSLCRVPKRRVAASRPHPFLNCRPRNIEGCATGCQAPGKFFRNLECEGRGGTSGTKAHSWIHHQLK